MKKATLSFASASVCLALSGPALADMVIDWNREAVAAALAARQSPSMAARNIAIVHLAIFEAVNSLEPRYTPYRRRLPTDPAASPQAAAAAAAHHALVRLVPEQHKELDAALQACSPSCPTDQPGPQDWSWASKPRRRSSPSAATTAR